MTEATDIRFFKTLLRICAARQDLDPGIAEAFARAVETGDPGNMRAARVAFDALGETLKSELLRQVHREMATDLSSIWDLLSTAGPGGQRPN